MVFNPEDGWFFGIMIATVVYFILLFIAFSQGKSIILRMSKAKEIEHKDNPMLYNIVEEMSLAAGMAKVPKVYIIDDPAPNAFAAGMTPDKSIVAVTSGLLNMMTRDELQGVVAHEISHIINRDIRYLTIATIMVASVAIISQMFLRTMLFSRGGSRSSSGGKGQGIIMIVAIVFSILAPIFIQFLYFSLSRKREYLADASGARLSRYPEGLASALEKIGGSTLDLKSADSSTAPMYIANPLKPKGQRLKNLSSTHPPLEERIRILRAMGGNSSITDYQQAYQSVSGKKAAFIPKKS